MHYDLLKEMCIGVEFLCAIQSYLRYPYFKFQYYFDLLLGYHQNLGNHLRMD